MRGITNCAKISAMALDVVDLRTFYASPLGELTRRLVGRLVRGRFDSCYGFSVLGIGYATPYLDIYRDEAVRVLAFMPAEQGVVNWPTVGRSASALIDTTALPLPDSRGTSTASRSPPRLRRKAISLDQFSPAAVSCP